MTRISAEFQLAERMGRIDTSQIRRMFDLASRLNNPINLSIGQPHFPTPEPVLEEINRALRDGKTAYTQTQGIAPLRERLARKFEEENGFQADPENILVSSGVSSLIQNLMLSYIEPGDRALLVDPYFLIHRGMLNFFNAKVETVHENFTAEDIAAINPEGLKLIMYSTPSNPSGYVIGEEQIKMLAELAEKSGALLVADEIYELFDYDGHFKSAASLYDKAVTLMGFSKSYNMTGLRLSAATGPREIIKAMTVLQQYTVVCAPSAVQYGGLKALDLDMSSYVDEYRKNRDYCMSRLEGKLKFSHPGGAFYIFPEIDGVDSEFAERAIKEKELLIVPGNIFSESKNHVRISYATSKENLERGMDAFLSLL